MPIGVHCESCGKSYKVKDELAGKKVRCPCGATVTVPKAAAKKPAQEVAAEKSPFMDLLQDELKRPHEAPAASGGPFAPDVKPTSAGHRPGMGAPPASMSKGGKSKLASDALLFAILGWVICGLLAFPARTKAIAALEELERNPGMEGHGSAQAAKILSTVQIVLICINLVAGVGLGIAALAMNN